MELQPGKSPILILPRDVSIEIFTQMVDDALLADDLDNTKPIDYLRSASQTSKSWRSIILASPILWSKVILLAALNQKSHYWRHEVLRRCRHLPLSVRGSVHSDDETKANVLISILREYWGKIRVLIVNIDVDAKRPGAIAKALTPILQRPAEHLQHFEFSIFSGSRREAEEDFFSPDLQPFSDNAPILRYFNAWNVGITCAPGRFVGLRHLAFTCRLSAGTFLNCLLHMPALESLELFILSFEDGDEEQLEEDDEDAIIPSVTLPRLVSVEMGAELDSEFTKQLIILNHITPASSCALNYTGVGLSPDPENFPFLSQAISSYYNLAPRPNDCELELDLTINTHAIHIDNNKNPTSFSITVAFEIGSNIEALIRNLDGSVLKRVTHFELIGDALTSADPNFDVFISHFVSVRKLSISPQILHALPGLLPNGNGIPFPSLQTLAISDIRPFHSRLLHSFIWGRRSMGHGFNMLELPCCTDILGREIYNPDEKRTWGDLSSLEIFDGLRVVCGCSEAGKHFSYVCGSQAPGELDFTKLGPVEEYDHQFETATREVVHVSFL